MLVNSIPARVFFRTYDTNVKSSLNPKINDSTGLFLDRRISVIIFFSMPTRVKW